jgi:hypothetical protein
MAPPSEQRVDDAVEFYLIGRASSPKEAMQFTGKFSPGELTNRSFHSNISKRAKRQYEALCEQNPSTPTWEVHVQEAKRRKNGISLPYASAPQQFVVELPQQSLKRSNSQESQSSLSISQASARSRSISPVPTGRERSNSQETFRSQSSQQSTRSQASRQSQSSVSKSVRASKCA